MAKIEEKVEMLVKSKIEQIGYKLYDVLYIKEGKDYILRIVIDKNGGINLDDCEKVNNEIADIIDKADYIKERYFLEVSSPGIERILRKDWQIKQFIGTEVEVKLFKKDNNGSKTYIGILKDINQDFLKIETEPDKEQNLDRSNIAQVKTIYREEI